jgi:hypothetical protein
MKGAEAGRAVGQARWSSADRGLASAARRRSKEWMGAMEKSGAEKNPRFAAGFLLGSW